MPMNLRSSSKTTKAPASTTAAPTTRSSKTSPKKGYNLRQKSKTTPVTKKSVSFSKGRTHHMTLRSMV